MLVIDDTALPKKGDRSVGVAAQYASSLGKTANCQTLMSLTLARGEVRVMVAADSDEVARAFRDDAARGFDMMSPRARASLAAKLCHCLLWMVNLFWRPFRGFGEGCLQ